MSFSWKSQTHPFLCLAPMAGYTDSAFRQIVKELAPETITFSEMVSSDGLRYNSRTNKNLMNFKSVERPFIVQLFGKIPENFAIAAKMVEAIGADGIDINMGCPAHKVIKSSHGAALIKNPLLAQEIVKATAEATKLPVSVKTRLGWEDSENLIEFCRGIEKAGAQAITIHGRTYRQAFGGTADWEPIYALKKELKIPVIGNGDIKSTEDAEAKLQNLDGIMVGRATFGNPWLMQELTEYFYKNKKKQDFSTPSFSAETSQDSGRNDAILYWIKHHKPIILKHCKYAIEMKGARIGLTEMRKHLATYVKGLPNAGELRTKLVLVESLEEVEEILETIKL